MTYSFDCLYSLFPCMFGLTFGLTRDLEQTERIKSVLHFFLYKICKDLDHYIPQAHLLWLKILQILLLFPGKKTDIRNK